MVVGLKAPVGEKKRISDGKPVKNTPSDTELVQLMLVANGYSVAIDGKCTPTLIKAINTFQKTKLGFKKPDGIVDPGGKTWKAGVGKFEALLKANETALANMIMITEGGKTKYVSKVEYERKAKEAKKKILDKANMMYGQAEVWLNFCQGVEETAQGVDGFALAFTAFIVSSVSGGKSDPPYGPLLDARSEATFLRALVERSNPDWGKILKQDAKASKAYNKGVKAYDKFINARIATASAIVGNLILTRELTFAAVEAYVTAKLIVTKKMSPAKAHALAAAGTESMKSSAGQLGEYLAGNNVTWEIAGRKVLIDTAFAGFAGLAGGKLTGAFANQITGRLSLYLAPKFSGAMSKKALNIFLNKIMSTKAMQNLVTSAVKETIGLFKPLIEKGRSPNEKEIKEAIIKTITSGVMGIAPIKCLKSFSSAAPAKVSNYVSKTLAPKLSEKVSADLLKTYGKKIFDKLPKDFQSGVFSDVAGAVQGKSAEIYALAAASGSNGDTKESQLNKLGQDGLRKDAALRKEIESLIRAKMENKLKSLERAE